MATSPPSDDNEPRSAGELPSEFIARGLASEAQARRDDEYYSSDEVHAELRRRLEQRRVLLATLAIGQKDIAAGNYRDVNEFMDELEPDLKASALAKGAE